MYNPYSSPSFYGSFPSSIINYIPPQTQPYTPVSKYSPTDSNIKEFPELGPYPHASSSIESEYAKYIPGYNFKPKTYTMASELKNQLRQPKPSNINQTINLASKGDIV